MMTLFPQNNFSMEDRNLTNSSEEGTTHQMYMMSSNNEERDLIINIMYGLTGLSVTCFNGLMLLLYALRVKVRKHVSFMMFQVFVFCCIHGLVMGIVYPTHRAFRYQISNAWCVIASLLEQLSDDYLLVLLSLLAIERLVILRNPFLPQKKAKLWASIATVIAMIVSFGFSILPNIHALHVPSNIDGKESDPYVRARDAFFKAFGCNGIINKLNVASPTLTLIIQVISLCLVTGIYIHMFFIAKKRLTRFNNMTIARRQKLRRASISVMLVAIVFFVTTLPFGITLQVFGMCYTGYFHDPQTCGAITLNLRYAMGILAHLGNLFAPMLFALFNPKIRAALRTFISCKSDNQTSVFSNGTDSAGKDRSS